MIVLCLLGFKLWQSDLVVDEVKDPEESHQVSIS